MAKLIVNGYECGGSSDTAASISCLDKDGNETTVQAELDKNRDDITELNYNLTELIDSNLKNGFRVMKLGKLVIVYNGGSSETLTVDGILCPYKPIKITQGLAKYFNGSADTTGLLQIGTDGLIRLFTISSGVTSGSYIVGNLIYFTND